MEPSYPNVLLTDSRIVFAFKLFIMLFALAGVVPYCMYAIYKKKATVPFLHPGQCQLDRVLWFELIGFGICTLFFLVAETTQGTFMLQ
jgi:hypothetical protein